MYSPLRLKEKYGIDLYFTSRLGGHSSSPYHSLNLAYHVGDDYDDVSANRRMVLEELKLGQQIYDMKQVHSDRIVDLGQDNYQHAGQSKIQADALVTGLDQRVVMVMGADCNLVMVVDTKNRVIAAVHSGWKGTLKKILYKTIGHLEQSYDSFAGNLLLYLGPSIRKCCYHVKEDLVERFVKIFGEGNYYYRKNNNIYLDLAGLNIQQARDAGLIDNNIFDSGICTFCDERFFSYRRNKVTGRQAAIGMIRG